MFVNILVTCSFQIEVSEYPMFVQIGLINLENEDLVKKFVEKTQTKFQVSN